VYLDYFRFAWVYAQLGQDWHEARTERVHLLLRVPDLADFVFVA
jgi:hypothetical protein